MKLNTSATNRPLILLIILILGFTSCSRKINYSGFDRDNLFQSQVTVSKRVYFFVNESSRDQAKGVAFEYDGKALVKPSYFTVDAKGNFAFRPAPTWMQSSVVKLVQSNDRFFVLGVDPADAGNRIGLERLNYSSRIPMDSARYRMQITRNVVKQEDILYAQAPGFYVSKSLSNFKADDYRGMLRFAVDNFSEMFSNSNEAMQSLKLDLYEPEGDKVSLRPLVVLAHGGAFLFGDKSSKMMEGLANEFARRGYVAASINYRLGTNLFQNATFERSIYRSAQDMRAAVRFLTANYLRYRIDPQKVFIGGQSAGAVAALHAAFMSDSERFKSVSDRFISGRSDLGLIDDIGFKTGPGYRLIGVLNCWGSIADLYFIDPEEKIPVISFHGDQDDILNIDSGLPFGVFLNPKKVSTIDRIVPFSGSRAIFNHMKKYGMKSELHVFRGEKHDPFLDATGNFNRNFDTIVTETADFFARQLAESGPKIVGNLRPDRNASVLVYSTDADAKTRVNWQVTGGQIIEFVQPNSVKVVLFQGAPLHAISIQTTEPGGFVKQATERIYVR